MAALADLMSLPQFEAEVRRVGRFGSRVALADPVAAALQLIAVNPTCTESRLLGRVLRALAQRSGEFRRAEISAFASSTLTIVVALMDAAQTGTTSERQWQDAVAAADAAIV